MPNRVAILTAGGYAPCLSSAVGALIETYDATDPDIELIAYQHGYHGLLTGNSVVIGPEERAGAALLHRYGGSPIGNSRVKLTNDDDCRRRGLIGEGETALEVAAARLQADGVDVLHTIGGDDTNTAAADLAAYLRTQGSELTVVGLPKTIDNDIVPIRQSLGAQTAAQEASRFAQHVLAEHGSNPRMLIVHEVMGRGQRLADRRGGARLHGLARRAGVAARHRPRPAPLGDPRGVRPRARHRPGRGGRRACAP